MASALRLFGLRAVVTDASSGIGEAIVRTLVKHGAEVLAVDSMNSGIETHFNGVRGVQGEAMDHGAPDFAENLAEIASQKLGVIDIVVCNFSLYGEKPIGNDDTDELNRVVGRQKNLVGGIAEQMHSLMKSSPAGRFIVLGFNRAVFSEEGGESYARSEVAIAEQVRQLAADNAAHGINVNYVQLGAIMTPASRRVFNADKSLRDYCIRRSAAKRLGEPVDIAKVVLFLATDDSVFVSGTGIRVDGGAATS